MGGRGGGGGIAPPPQRPSPQGQLWRITGGHGTSGILVRLGRSLDSTEIRQRISAGSLVEEVELDFNRLHYRLIEGDGPRQGWITIRYKDKPLAERVDRPRGVEDQQAPLEETVDMDNASAIFLPGDPVHVYSTSKNKWAEDGVVQEVAEEETLVDNQRMPPGSVLVVYDNGQGVKWVSPQEQGSVLRKVPVFVPGDKVHVWSVSSNSWAEDGVVQDVASEPMEIEGQQVPRGSAFVIYNGGQGLKCIVPEEQPRLLRLALPAPAWFAMGDAVHVWSVNGNAWAEDGVVQQIAAEDLIMDGQQVARGAVFVVYNQGQGMKWVMPWEQEELLRGAQPERAGGELGAGYAGQNDHLGKSLEDGDGYAPDADPGDAQAAPKNDEEEDDMELGEMMIATETWEPDESAKAPSLGLFFGSVVTVLRKDADDGWLYGKTIDGAKGWFPADKVKPESEFRFNESSSEDEDDQPDQEEAPDRPRESKDEAGFE